MSLNYNLSKIHMYKDNFDLAYQEYNSLGSKYSDVKPYLKRLIFSSMMISLNQITYKNAPEWYARLNLCEEIYHMNIFEKWEEDNLVRQEIEPKELMKHIGLATNSTNRSRPDWIKTVLRNDKTITYTSQQLVKKLKAFENQFEERLF